MIARELRESTRMQEGYSLVFHHGEVGNQKSGTGFAHIRVIRGQKLRPMDGLWPRKAVIDQPLLTLVNVRGRECRRQRRRLGGR